MDPSTIGIWHTTTFQSVAERQRKASPGATLAVGHKRTLDEAQGDQAQPSKRPFPRLAPDLPRQPSRLAASEIVAVDDDASGGPSQYTQRVAVAATPSSTADPLLNLRHDVYGLPAQLVANFASMGINDIYPWQKQCLLGPGILQGEKNIVYCAPTGGGKSLVADVLMLKKVLATREAKALLVLPYVALVQEKVRWLRNVVQDISREALGQADEDPGSRLWAKRADRDTIRVVGFFGGGRVRATWTDFDIAVCTIEKANSLINTAIDDCVIPNLRSVVFDELHMIDDGYRGYLLELMGTKLLCLDHRVQIIGMSATLANIGLLKTWLQGHSYETRYRPIPIKEHLVCEGKVYLAETTCGLLATATQLNPGSRLGQASTRPTRSIRPSQHKEFQDLVLNAVVALASETAQAGFGALVFASSRAACESDALLISRVLPSFHDADVAVQEKRLDLLGELRSLATGFDPILEKTILSGVAFHHAGLTTEERGLVASAYDAGTIKVCVATCSLAAGINLPARRVILHSARMGRDLVGPSMLRQMRGRAGRKGKDEVGETYLCCRQDDLDGVLDLMHAELPQISSCLTSDQRRIQRALLEIIVIRLATSREAVDDYMQKTMLSHCTGPGSLSENVDSSLRDLQAKGFISADAYGSFQATQLGKAVVASSIDPEDGLFIHSELLKSLQAFVMDGDMHVLYCFTPVHDLGGSPVDWKVFWNEMGQLDESGLRVMSFLGLEPAVVTKMRRGGTLRETTPGEVEAARRYRRFYLALQLRDLCNEVPVHRVAKKYDMPRGSVQNLAQTCQGFAAGMIKFCECMGWGALAAALDHLSDRLRAGAKSDLLALAKITFVKSRTARVFWDNGYKTVAAIANADPNELVPVLLQAQPNKVRSDSMKDDMYMDKMLDKAKVIAESANKLWHMEMQQEVYEEF